MDNEFQRQYDFDENEAMEGVWQIGDRIAPTSGLLDDLIRKNSLYLIMGYLVMWSLLVTGMLVTKAVSVETVLSVGGIFVVPVTNILGVIVGFFFGARHRGGK